MPSRARIAVDIETSRIIAILRGIGLKTAIGVVDSLIAGGIEVLEVTLNTPGALGIIDKLSTCYKGKILLGAGTVIDTEGAFAAVNAGAQFLVTPTYNCEVIKIAGRYGKPVVSGALTPTEALAAYETGAEFVKIFPAGPMGPDYIKQLIGPLSQIPLVAVGGINASNAEAFIKAGAVAVGVGGSLVDKGAIERADWDYLTEEARKLVKAVEKAI